MSRTYPSGVREPPFAYDAPRQTVSLTINSDLFARAKALGINASRIAELALAAELQRRQAELMRIEVQADIAAYETFVEKHGSFAEAVRKHYRPDDDAI